MKIFPAHPRTAAAVWSAALVLGASAASAQPASAQPASASDAGAVHPSSTGTRPPPIVPLPAPGHFVSTVDNRYSPFVPGTRWVYRGGTPDEQERIVVRVLQRTKLIEGIEATVVRDTVSVDGEVVEDTFDWYGQDRRDRVWYLGENTKTYEDGQVVSTEGSWQAGVDGAKAGIVMFAHPRVGRAFRQEYYAGHAEDQAQFLTLDTRVATEARVFRRVRMTEDTTPLDPDITELKFYAPGVGVVLEFDLAPEAGRTELIRFDPPE